MVSAIVKILALLQINTESVVNVMYISVYHVLLQTHSNV